MKDQLTAGRWKRDPYFDNARFILVSLVVLGHLVSPVREANEALFFANNFLASFRMPALIFLAGFFTKHFNREPKRHIKKLVLGIFLPYMLFQIFYLKMDGLAENAVQLMLNVFAPNFGMWFLLSLFAWNLLLFPFSRLKHPILAAFAIGVGIGWVEGAGEYGSLSRTFVFFPLFLIGHYLQQDQLDWFKGRSAKGWAAFSLAVNGFILSFFSLEQARNALLARHPYAEIAASSLEGTGLRLIFYGVMLLGIVSFLPWVPKKEFIFTHLGRRTAYVYLLHLFFVKLFTEMELFPDRPGMLFFALLPFVWLAIVFGTASNAAVFFAKPAVEGKVVLPSFRKTPVLWKSANLLEGLVHKK